MPATFGYELPPGCTYADIDRAAGDEPTDGAELECRECGHVIYGPAVITWYAEDDWDGEPCDDAPTCGECGADDWRVTAP